jgi:hypothetical protein
MVDDNISTALVRSENQTEEEVEKPTEEEVEKPTQTQRGPIKTDGKS